MSWQLGLAWLAHVLDRDLQAAARRAGAPRRLWLADRVALERYLRLDPNEATDLIAQRGDVDVRALHATVHDAGCWWTGLGTESYPPQLAECVDPPFALLGRGARVDSGLLAERPVIAMVGSRRPTAGGRRFAATLAVALARHGAIIVSGLALGIDAAAHQGAIDGGGQTIAVLGSALDAVAPKSNVALAERIVHTGGALVSEYWFGTQAQPWRFPARNRIVAGLADGVIVIEAAERSGALITADFALELGRPVLAVPGPPQAVMSAGCHGLLRAGAALCECVDDVVAEIPHTGWHDGPPQDLPALNHLEAALYAALQREPARVDDLVAVVGRDAPVVLAALGTLELEGVISRSDGDRYEVLAR